MKKLDELKSAIESLLLVSDEPVSANKLSEISGCQLSQVKDALRELEYEYIEENRGIQLRAVAGGYRFYTHPAHSEKVSLLVESSRKRRLTPAALETLAIVAYKQPVTRAQVFDIRGVNSEAVINSLLEKELIYETGRDDTPGQPILYATTSKFLEDLGINSLADLPALDQFEPDEETKKQIAVSLTGNIGATDAGEA